MGRSAPTGGTLALIESPVQLLNTLEWTRARGAGAAGTALLVLPPRQAGGRGQLRRMAELARDAGHPVHWREVRPGPSGLRGLTALVPRVRRASHLVIGDPFSRRMQLLLSMAGPERVTVVDDGTATLEFLAQMARGERLVRWHRRPPSGLRAALFGPIAGRAVSRLVPGPDRRVEVFTAMPVGVPAPPAELGGPLAAGDPAGPAGEVPVGPAGAGLPPGLEITRNRLEWTRSAFGPPAVQEGADLVGTSLVETGVVREDRYLAGVAELAARHDVRRYFAHRRESPEKLRRIAADSGLEIVRPDLPLELVARRGPIARRVLSFPSTVVHTLPPVLAGTGAAVTACPIPAEWLSAGVTERAGRFLASVVESAPAGDRPDGGAESGGTDSAA
ncbi:hypothetical protein [Streptomyces sp. ST2-7A]|uniref:hypothetical protein n=1 Tax=Streptomyces sp. ST2-7A TaxID=2907214 RepID=UPI0035ABEE80